MSKKTGHVVANQALATVEDSDGFKHTSASATSAQLMESLDLAPTEAETPGDEKQPPAQVAAVAVAEADPLDTLTDDEIAERADLDRLNPKHLPRKTATAQLVKRATKRRTELEAERTRASQLEAELAEAKKVKPAEEPAPPVTAAEPDVFVRKAFDTPRPKFDEPADPYDLDAVRAARERHETETDAWYTARETHNDEQKRLEADHTRKQTEGAAHAESEAITAARRATAILYDRGKARHADYDQTLQAFIAAGGQWSPGINLALLKLGRADLDLAADVTRALVDPANMADVRRLATLPAEDVPYALNSLIADPTRLKRPAAVKAPAVPVVAETAPAGPAAGASVSHAREPFNPGGTSPESPVHGRDVSITAIPTTNFDVFMKRRDDEDGRGRRARG